MPSLMRTWKSSYEPTPHGYSEHTSDALETGASQISAIEETKQFVNREKWQDLLDRTLIEVGKNPQIMADADEGIAAPTDRAIAKAVAFARFARDAMIAPPGQALPDGDGGLVIQHALPNGATESFEVDAKGNCSIWLYPRAPGQPIQWEVEISD
jgi:hypothetical protein